MTILSLLLFLQVVVIHNTWAQDEKVSLEEIDAIATRAPDLNSFLANESLINEYYQALESYYGPDRFTRKQFDAILTQMKTTVATVPDLGKRLWETNGLGEEFSIESKSATYGRELGPKWNGTNFIEAEKKKVQASQEVNTLTPEAEKIRIDGFKRSLVLKENSFDATGLSKSQATALQGKHFQSLKNSTETIEIAEYYLRKLWDKEGIKDVFNSGDPDLIIDSLKALRDNPRGYFDGEEIPSTVVSKLKELLPDYKKLLENEEMFKTVMRMVRGGKLVPVGGTSMAKYDFVPVPRRLHGIWKGIHLGECIAGNCNYLARLTPERWATVALKDSQLFHVEKNGNYSGFVEVVPGKIGNRTLATIGIGAPDLRKKVSQQTQDGQRKVSSLYRLWLEEAKKRKPPGVDGFVLSDSSAIDNAGVLTTARGSASYFFGERIKDSDGAVKFQLLDPLAAQITAASPASVYSDGRMVLDATSKEVASLVVLDTDYKDELLNDGPALEAMVRDHHPRSLEISSRLAQTNMASLGFLNELLDHSDPRFVSNGILGLLKSDVQITSTQLEKVFKHGDRSNFTAMISKIKFDLTESHMKTLARIAPQALEEAFKKFPHPVSEDLLKEIIASGDLQILKMSLRKVQRPISQDVMKFTREHSFLRDNDVFFRSKNMGALIQLDEGLVDPLNRAWATDVLKTNLRNNIHESLDFDLTSRQLFMSLKPIFKDLAPILNSKTPELAEWILSNPEELSSFWLRKLNPRELSSDLRKKLFDELLVQLKNEKDLKKWDRLMLAVTSGFFNESELAELRRPILKMVSSRSYLSDEEFKEIHHLFRPRVGFPETLKLLKFEESDFPHSFRRFFLHPDRNIRDKVLGLKEHEWANLSFSKNYSTAAQQLDLLVAKNYKKLFEKDLKPYQIQTLESLVKFSLIEDPEFSKHLQSLSKSSDPQLVAVGNRINISYEAQQKSMSGNCLVEALDALTP